MLRSPRHLALVMALIIGIPAAASIAAAQKPAPAAPRVQRSAGRRLSLFAGPITAEASANRVYCGLNDLGVICSGIGASPVLGGANWPIGTSDQYLFRTGIQVAGIIPANAGFAWAGDTVGAWVMDTRGVGTHSDRLTGIYDSRAGTDLESWPLSAWPGDTSLFHPTLIGARSVSLEDTWTRYWDGDTTRLGGRSHTMGLLFEQRSLSFDHPSGAEDILFVLFRLTNITARDAAPYQALAAAGYTPPDIAEIAALGAEFQRQAEARFGILIPDGGYPIGNAWVNLVADQDVGDATNNYVSAALPFAMSLAWKADFRESSWQFPPDVFHAPFATAPGLVGIKYLRAPGGAPFGFFGAYTGCSSANICFPAPAGVAQGYRYFSGTPDPSYGDAIACSYPASRHLCRITSAPSDQHTMQSAGPFTLAPGQSVVFALAYVFAPALLSNPGRPSFDLNQYIGNTTLAPGEPPNGDRLVQGLDTLRVLDAAIGWVSHADADGSGAIEEDEVVTVRGSLLHQAQVAQAMFDNRFARPEAPAPPDFLLMPGSNAVTVVWKPSATETTGDPYYAIASISGGTLHDPNFRRYDVEGYRIWRGSSPDQLTLLAQFDYDTTRMLDYTGDLWNFDYQDLTSGEYRCAPELGITASCPAFPHPVALSDGGLAYPGLVQIPPGGRSRLANDPAQYARGALRIDRADTAVSGGGSRFPPLTDTGVPFVFTDSTVRNGVRYYYAVTAFDVNSIRSGPSSLESAPAVRAVTPRVPSGQETGGGLGAPELVRPNGTVVPAIPTPTIDTGTGVFSGPMPPADVSLSFVAFVAQLVPGSGSLDLFVDSIVPGDALAGAAGEYRMRVVTAAGTDTLRIPVNIGAFAAPDFRFSGTFIAARADSAQAARFGAGAGFGLPGSLSFTVPGAWRLTGQGRGDANGDPSRSALNGPRWWTGSTNENTADPNSGNCAPSAGNCGPPPSPNRTAGALAGVTTLMNIQAYNTVPSVPMRNLEAVTAYFYRAADFRVYWGGGGVVDSVVDLTHGVRVPFSQQLYASWGILNTAAFGAGQPAGQDGSRGLLTWADIFCVAPAGTMVAGGNCSPGPGETPPALSNAAQLGAIHANGSQFVGAAGPQTLASTGTGFIFYLSGKFFIIQMAALPAPGTAWNARFYTGAVRTSTSTGGMYSWVPSFRPPAVPGMHLRVAYQGSVFDPVVSVDSVMRRIHTVPDPYYGVGLSLTPGVPAQIRFVNVPSQSIIRIYSSSGLLTALLTNNDPTGGGEVIWDVRSRGGRLVASGVYFYHVEAPDGRTKVGRFTVVQ